MADLIHPPAFRGDLAKEGPAFVNWLWNFYEAVLANQQATDTSLDTASQIAAAAQVLGLGAIPLNLVDAKGDLIVATANNVVARKAVGANGSSLYSDSAEGGGIVWSLPVLADVTAGRAAGVVYQNTSKRLGWVAIVITGAVAGQLSAYAEVENVDPPTIMADKQIIAVNAAAASSHVATLKFPVAPGDFYTLTLTTGTLTSWAEMA